MRLLDRFGAAVRVSEQQNALTGQSSIRTQAVKQTRQSLFNPSTSPLRIATRTYSNSLKKADTSERLIAKSGESQNFYDIAAGIAITTLTVAPPFFITALEFYREKQKSDDIKLKERSGICYSGSEEKVGDYLERTEESEILEKLGIEAPSQDDEVKYCYLKGQGKVGKTQIVRDYVEKAKNEKKYQIIGVVDVTTNESFTRDIKKLHDTLFRNANASKTNDIDSLASSIKNELFQKGRWLLVFDGINNKDTLQQIQGFFPESGGHLMLAGRYFPKEINQTSTNESLMKNALVEIREPDATSQWPENFLRQLLNTDETIKEFCNKLFNDGEALPNFFRTYGRSPAALRYFASIIKKHGKDFNNPGELLDYYVKNKNELIDDGTKIDGYDKTIVLACSDSVEIARNILKTKITEVQQKSLINSVDLILKTLSCFDNAGPIDTKIFNAHALSRNQSLINHYQEIYPDMAVDVIKKLIVEHYQIAIEILYEYGVLQQPDLKNQEDTINPDALLREVIYLEIRKDFKERICQYENVISQYFFNFYNIEFKIPLYFELAISILEDSLQFRSTDAISNTFPLLLGFLQLRERILSDNKEKCDVLGLDMPNINDLVEFCAEYTEKLMTVSELRKINKRDLAGFIKLLNSVVTNTEYMRDHNNSIALIAGDEIDEAKKLLNAVIGKLRELKYELETTNLPHPFDVAAVLLGISSLCTFASKFIYASPLDPTWIIVSMIFSVIYTLSYLNPSQDPQTIKKIMAIDLYLSTAIFNQSTCNALANERGEASAKILDAIDLVKQITKNHELIDRTNRSFITKEENASSLKIRKKLDSFLGGMHENKWEMEQKELDQGKLKLKFLP